MAERPIILYGHPTLRLRAEPIGEFDGDVRALVDDLFDSMYADRGIGLAAPQVDVLKRVITVDPTATTDKGTRVLALVNPEVLEYSGASRLEEGCLSIPGVYAEVRRPERIQVAFRDVDGQEHEEEFEGLMARVIQHEVDHLDGKLFVDHLSAMRRSLLMRKLRAIDHDQDGHGTRL